MSDIERIRGLVGDKAPKGSVPAAWWITTDADQIAAYDRWVADYKAYVDQVQALAEKLGLRVEDARLSSFAGQSRLTGFAPTRGMRLWSGHPEYVPAPVGWRIDSKSDHLVPKRKTKAYRESQANKDFKALRVVPDVVAYMSGLPSEIYLDDRDWGGTAYGVHYRRGAKCVMAFSGGDPDRQSEDMRHREARIDAAIWERLPLSALLILREKAA
ncbi:hypothetical protein KXR83_05580 [Williamsia muralis]|uniref:hypothetical protein n=1 Tax=Williamsia marianensis TaxID=85044 RepID=UPI003F135237